MTAHDDCIPGKGCMIGEADCPAQHSRTARCGRTAPHTAHRTTDKPFWCAGNIAIVTAVGLPDLAWRKW